MRRGKKKMNYADNAGKKCDACKKGVIYYLRQKNGTKELEMIGCTNPKCLGYFEPSTIL